MKFTKVILMASAMATSFAATAYAEKYRLTTYAPPNEAASIHQTYIADTLREKTNGAIDFEVFYASTLVPAKEQMKAIGNGVAHAGFQAMGYVPSDAPMNGALTAYGFIEQNATAIAMAFADWGMHDAGALAQYAKNNVLPFGGFSTPTYPFICNTDEPITSLKQFQGLKVRFPGGANAKLTQDLGGVPVNIPGNEIYQALQTGAIDCAGILAGWLNIDNSLDEVSKSVTLANFTGSYNSPVHLANLDFWRSLTNEQRAIYLETTARASAKMQIKFNTDNDKALATTAALGHPIVELDDEFKAAVQAWVDDGVGDMAGVAKSTYGIEDPAAFFATFDPYVKKWGALIRGMENVNDEDALTQMIMDNMIGDLDPASYGMN
jgi:TRAP-type C4-dicarboxylate transport system substrate-binding protein